MLLLYTQLFLCLYYDLVGTYSITLVRLSFHPSVIVYFMGFISLPAMPLLWYLVYKVVISYTLFYFCRTAAIFDEAFAFWSHFVFSVFFFFSPYQLFQFYFCCHIWESYGPFIDKMLGSRASVSYKHISSFHFIYFL